MYQSREFPDTKSKKSSGIVLLNIVHEQPKLKAKPIRAFAHQSHGFSHYTHIKNISHASISRKMIQRLDQDLTKLSHSG